MTRNEPCGSLITESLRNLDVKSFFILGEFYSRGSFRRSVRRILRKLPPPSERERAEVSLKFRVDVDHRSARRQLSPWRRALLIFLPRVFLFPSFRVLFSPSPFLLSFPLGLSFSKA